MKLSIKPVFFLLSCILFYGCVTHPGPVPFYPVPPEVEPYFLFRKGSYWIYEEKNSSNVDSVYLYRSQIERLDGESDFNYNFELYSAGSSRSYTGDSIRGHGSPTFGDKNMWAYEEDYLSTASPGYAITFIYPLKVGDRERLGNNFALTLESETDSMVIGGETFYDVLLFRHVAMMFPNQAERIYFAKNAGVIKRELFNGEVWELKKYFINK